MRLTAVLGISHGRLRRRIGFGPRSRLDLLRNLVTALVRHERIETTRARADEMRFYAEHVSGGEGREETGGGVLATVDPTPSPATPLRRRFCPAADRARQARRHGPAGHAPGRLLVDGERGSWGSRGGGGPGRGRGTERCRAAAALQEKDLVHKLFKVLAPRFAPHQGDYTRMVRIPKNDSLDRAERAVIEYKGNPLPPLPLPRRDGEKTLVNQLLKGYREERGTTV